MVLAMQCSNIVLSLCSTIKGLRAIAANLKFLKSPLPIRVIATRSPECTLNQVTHFSSYTPLPLLGRSHDLRFPSTHQKLYFSSKPNSIVELVLTNDWSQGLEHELEKCYPSLTHETALDVLKQLDNNPEKASCFFNWVSKREWFRASSLMFSLSRKVLANKKTTKQFWTTLRMMEEKGFYLDNETNWPILDSFKTKKMKRDSAGLKSFNKRMVQENARQSVVTKVVGIISGSEWGDLVVNELAELKIQLSDDFVIRVLEELRNDPLKAYKFFQWVGKQSGYQHNTVTYNAIARVLASTDSIEEFWNVIEEMKSVGHELDIDTYTKISRKLEKNKMIEDAVKLYELMMDGPYQPSAHDCGILLNSIYISASYSANLDLVFRVAKKYESTGHTLTKEIYDGIHRSLIRARKFDEAENIVKTMRSAGYEPDNITYSHVVSGLCKMKRFEEAWKVLEEMESCGCIPDSNTRSILIHGYCAANEVDNALLCLGKMIEKGCNANAAAMGVLVNSFLSQRRIEDAYKLLVDMVLNNRASPQQGTYEELIENLLGIGKFEEALDLLCLMRKHKYPPFNQPVVRYISKSGTVEDAEKFLKAWSKGSPQSHSAYFHVFESFIKEGRLSEAKDLLCKCPSHIRRRKQICDFFAFVENRMAAT